MAITSTLTAVDNSSIASGQKVTAQTTISNSGASAVTVTVVPKINPKVAAHFTQPAAVKVGAGGSAIVSWDIVYHHPAEGDGRQQVKHTITATAFGDDASITAISGPSVLLTVGPRPAYFVTGPGAARLDSNRLSYMIAVI